MGIMCLLIGMLAISLQISGINVDSSKVFREHFPVWRGASYLIIYFWILGISVLFYEKAQINYNLIFHFG